MGYVDLEKRMQSQDFSVIKSSKIDESMIPPVDEKTALENIKEGNGISDILDIEINPEIQERLIKE